MSQDDFMKMALAFSACRSLDLFRFDTDAARLIGCTRQSVFRWRNEGIPAKHVIKLARALEIHPHDIRPDCYPEFLIVDYKVRRRHGVCVGMDGQVMGTAEAAA